MGEQKKTKNKILNFIMFLILFIALYFAFSFYQENNFNNFVRSEQNMYTSEFKRDKEIKYSKNSSYRIKSDEYNDAMFFQTIEVKENTPYKISCMIKTEDVISENQLSGSGAQVSINDTTERSIALQGTNDWQKVEMIINSKDRTELNVGFRLGGYIDNAKGTAWFSEFKIEEGVTEDSNEWNFACFLFNNVDVTINQKRIQLSMTETDRSDIRDTVSRFEYSCRQLSKNKMISNCTFYSVNEPITTLSYDEEFGYFVAPEDVENQIKDVISANNYDHIFIIVRLGNEEYNNEIEINDWIGLGSMDYYGIGFSNIRLPNSSNDYVYKYNTKINTFPEEVLLHEFLHSLERNSKEYGYDIPALHDNEKYEYKQDRLNGLKDWYEDYMNKEIKSQSGMIGLEPEIYTLKPAKNSNFEFTYELDELQEPTNIIGQIKQLAKNLVRNIQYIFN